MTIATIQKGQTETGDCIVFLKKEEGRMLMEMLEAARNANPRKIKWEAMLLQFSEELCCW